MSKHVSYRGLTIDMDSLRRENEKTTAIGNMRVNAKGDQLARGGGIAKTADQLARENHRIKSTVVKTGLKGPMPQSPETPIQKIDKPTKEIKVAKTKEVELPSGDIIIESEKDEN
ncbi:MAG TPA: hypothetical protein VIY47_10075 [Ignavibacteriaceae bacterium]